MLEERNLGEDNARSFAHENEDFEHTENDAYYSLENQENAIPSRLPPPPNDTQITVDSHTHFVIPSNSPTIITEDSQIRDNNGFDVRFEEPELSETECEIYLQQIDRELGNSFPQNSCPETTSPEEATCTLSSDMESVQVETSVGKEVSDVEITGAKFDIPQHEMTSDGNNEATDVQSNNGAFSQGRTEYDATCEPTKLPGM